MEFLELEVNGTPPAIAGQICEGFICEGYIYKDEPVASANVTYLRFNGKWFRLYFEFRLVFWREFNLEPKPWEVIEESWTYPHVDIGASSGVIGQELISYEMMPTRRGCKVLFNFANGRRITIEDYDDVASYMVC